MDSILRINSKARTLGIRDDILAVSMGKKRRRVVADAAVMPRPGLTVDQISIP